MLVRIPGGMSAAEMQAVLVSDAGKLGCGLIQPSTLESAQSPDMVAWGRQPHMARARQTSRSCLVRGS